MTLLPASGPGRRVLPLIALLVAALALVVLIGFRLNPRDPAALSHRGQDISLFGKMTILVPSCTFLEPNRPQLVTISRGSDQLHIDAHNADGRVDYTMHGIDARLCFATMHEHAVDLDGDGRQDLLWSAHYRGGALVSPDSSEVDSVVVGLFTPSRGLIPFWTIARPRPLGEAPPWNVEIALPEFMRDSERERLFVINVAGRGAWTARRCIGLFTKGRRPRLVRELAFGVVASSCQELSTPEGPQLLLGARAPAQGGRAVLVWTRPDGRDTTLAVVDTAGATFLVDSLGVLRWATTFGVGAGTTLVRAVDKGGDTLACTFIVQAFSDDAGRLAHRVWLERGSGRRLAADTLHGLLRPFIGPASWAGSYLGLLGDSLGTAVVGLRPGAPRPLRGLSLPASDSPLPLVDLEGQAAFALGDGPGRVSLFDLQGRRRAVLRGGEPAQPARYALPRGGFTDRLLLLDSPSQRLVAAVAHAAPGWWLWRQRWPLATGTLFTGLLVVLILHERARERRRIRELREAEARAEEERIRREKEEQEARQQEGFIDDLERQLEVERERTRVLEQLRTRLAEMFDGQGDAILVVDSENAVMMVNKACAELLRQEAPALAGRSLEELGSDLLVDFLRRRRLGELPGEGGYYVYHSVSPKGTFRVSDKELDGIEGEANLLMVTLRNISEVVRRTPAPRQHPEIVGESPAMLELLKQVEDARNSLSNVLIQGETGTGKDLVAKALHRSSLVAKGPYETLNCAAIAHTLLESEFFGTARGAFTGAVDRKGRFEQADGGTLLLDEIGDMELALQAKLLLVLETGEFQRVGESKTRRAQVRIVAATNQDLTARLEQGQFRSDLYYRLHVLAMRVPPLRERREDIPLLAEHFVTRAAEELQRPIRGIDRETMELLRAHPWPGNVRQLKNALEGAVQVCRGDRILPAHLSREVLQGATVAVPAAGSVNGHDNGRGDGRGKPLTLTRHEIVRALEENGWHRTQAAKQLGISRSSLYNYLREFGILRPQGKGRQLD